MVKRIAMGLSIETEMVTTVLLISVLRQGKSGLFTPHNQLSQVAQSVTKHIIRLLLKQLSNKLNFSSECVRNRFCFALMTALKLYKCVSKHLISSEYKKFSERTEPKKEFLLGLNK